MFQRTKLVHFGTCTAFCILAGGLYGASTNAAAAGKLTVLHTFSGAEEGNLSLGKLYRDAAGNLFGTTELGGVNGAGNVFEVSPSGILTVVHSFQTGNDGYFPYAGVIADREGTLFGTTSGGGASGFGTVFKIGENGIETIVYNFDAKDGAQPEDDLIIHRGNLYGTTAFGGANGYGTVFKLTRNGQLTALYSFAENAGGFEPLGGLVRDAAGNLYGTTSSGGAQFAGTIFKIAPDNTETLLYSFTDGGDGGFPFASLVMDAAGNLYGTAAEGANNNCGTVFEFSAQGVFKVLYAFGGGADGCSTRAGLIVDESGYLYGNTASGGTYGQGTIFNIAPTGKKKILYSFTGGTDGGGPVATLLANKSANVFYGTTTNGGSGYGSVFKFAK